MLLTLMRHGEAESRAESDATRRLTEAGHADNLATARALLEFNPEYSHAFHSPYIRAQETAADLSSVMPGIEFKCCDDLTPEVDVMRLCKFIEVFSQEHDVRSMLLVGHNPLLSRLLSLLLDGERAVSRHLDTSNLVCLNVELLAPACAELDYWLKP